MSASDHLQGEQLAMFMPAKDLIKIQPNRADFNAHQAELGEPGTRKSFWTSKLAESRGPWRGEFHESVGLHGVERPVVLHHGPEHLEGTMIAQGHHRIVSAVASNPEQLVPVHHYGEPHHSFVQAVRERQWRNYGE